MGPLLGGAAVGGVEDARGCRDGAAAVAEDFEPDGLSRVTTRPRRHCRISLIRGCHQRDACDATTPTPRRHRAKGSP